MKKVALTSILALFSCLSLAQGKAIENLSESCLYEVQKIYIESRGWKFGEFEGVVKDGGGYGVYRSFSLLISFPVKGQVRYKQGQVSVTPNNEVLNLFANSLEQKCAKTVNKSKQQGPAAGTH